MRQLSWVVGCVAGATIAACGSGKSAERGGDTPAAPRAAATPRPGWVDDPRGAAPLACRGDAFMVASGQGDTAQKADEQARNALARQVSSSIREVIQRKVTASGGSDRDARADFYNSVVATQCSAFGHAELMDIAGSWTDGASFHSLACLDRGRAATVIQQELTASLATFRRSASDALAAAEKKDRAAFLASYAQAQESASPVMPRLFQLDLLAPGHDVTSQFWKDLDATVAAASSLRAGTRFAVEVEGQDIPAEEKDRIASSMAEGIRSAGITAVRSAQCGDAAFTLKLRLSPQCAYRSLGHTCQVSAVASLQECAQARAPQTFDFPQAAQLKGISPREQAQALGKALKALGNDSVSEWTQQLARAQLPAVARSTPAADGNCGS